jgi:hypothetical protein
VKESGLPKRVWLEEDEHAEVELSMVDERDSVSLQLKALTKSRLGPEFRSVSSIRISYSDWSSWSVRARRSSRTA